MSRSSRAPELRITDSVYPFHDKHAIFRIELEYGDSAVKWVIYRELKDFVNLHAHYRVANLRQGIDKFPAFPKTSLPYLNWLKSEGRGNVGKADFARMQREALENYLLKLIRATVRPLLSRLAASAARALTASSSRRCSALAPTGCASSSRSRPCRSSSRRAEESRASRATSCVASALLTLSLKPDADPGRCHLQRVTSSSGGRRKQPGFHPISWKKRHEPKWFIVRDSYIVAVESPASVRSPSFLRVINASLACLPCLPLPRPRSST